MIRRALTIAYPGGVGRGRCSLLDLSGPCRLLVAGGYVPLVGGVARRAQKYPCAIGRTIPGSVHHPPNPKLSVQTTFKRAPPPSRTMAVSDPGAPLIDNARSPLASPQHIHDVTP